MSNEKMFEFAVRNKMRFPFKGLVSVEDLWDLPLESLDSVFKTLNSQAKQIKEQSLLDTKSKEDEILDLQIEIVKHIVQVKLDERNKRLQAKEKKEKKAKLMAVLADKQDQELLNKSPEEIQAMIDQLEE